VELWNLVLQSFCWWWSRLISSGEAVEVSSINFWAKQQEYIFYWYVLTAGILVLLFLRSKKENNPFFILSLILSTIRIMSAFVFVALSPQWNNTLQVLLGLALTIIVISFGRRSAI